MILPARAGKNLPDLTAKSWLCCVFLVMRDIERQLGPILDPELAEDRVQIFFDRAFSQMEITGDLFIRFCLIDQLGQLLFPGTQSFGRLGFARPGLAAIGTNVRPANSPELLPATRTAPQSGCHRRVNERPDKHLFSCDFILK
jgi:hypothetical protein